MLRYLGVFLLTLLHANIDMARCVLSPSLPINPALVEVKTQLKSSLGNVNLWIVYIASFLVIAALFLGLWRIGFCWLGSYCANY